MKSVIVAVGFILLGCVLFDMIAGEGMSLRTASGEAMKIMLDVYGE